MPPRSHSPSSISLGMSEAQLVSSPQFSPQKFSPFFHPFGEIRTLNSVRELHAQIIKMPKKRNLVTMDGSMMRNYLQFGDFESATKVFFVGFARNYLLWNSFLEEFASFGGDSHEILAVFKELHDKGVKFDSKALTVVLKICLALMELFYGSPANVQDE